MEPLSLPPQLAPTPASPPRYGIEAPDAAGKREMLADPRATRALLASDEPTGGDRRCRLPLGRPRPAMAEIMSRCARYFVPPAELVGALPFCQPMPGTRKTASTPCEPNYRFDDLTFDDLMGFRSIDCKLTGHAEAHINPRGVLVSNGPLGSALPQAQGLAMGEALCGGGRTTICTVSDGACMEGEAKEALAAIPGLASKKKIGSFLLIVSDNNTKLSGRIDADSYPMEPTFDALAALGWELIRIDDGHDLSKVHPAIDAALARLKEGTDRPIALVVKTVKGKGVAATEEAAAGGHGYPLKARDPSLVEFIREIYGKDAPPEEFLQKAQDLIATPIATQTTPAGTEKKEKVQAGIARAAIAAAQRGWPVVSLSADLHGSTGMGAFHKKFPDRCIDLGVAEANMVSAAVGLSLRGFIPLVDTFSQFGVTKGKLPLIMSSLSRGPIIALFSHTGFQDAADGASHQCLTYFSALAGIPNTTLVNCSCSEEAETLLSRAIQNFYQTRQEGGVPESTVFFMGREQFPVRYQGKAEYRWEDIQILRDGGRDITLAASGPMVGVALAAEELLRNNAISATVLNIPFVNSTRTDAIAACLEKTGGCLITLEDHRTLAGQGAMLCHALLQRDLGFPLKVRSLGIDGTFGRSAYKAADLYRTRKMSPEGILQAARELLETQF